MDPRQEERDRQQMAAAAERDKQRVARLEQEATAKAERVAAQTREHRLKDAKAAYLAGGGSEADWPKHSEAIWENILREESSDRAIAADDAARFRMSTHYREF